MNYVQTLYERQLCMNNIAFERTTSTLQEQRPHLSEQRRIHYEETRNYRLTCGIVPICEKGNRGVLGARV